MPRVFESDSLNQIAWFVVGIGALNWGTVELSSTNLLVDTLSLSSNAVASAYVVIGAFGAAILAAQVASVMGRDRPLLGV